MADKREHEAEDLMKEGKKYGSKSLTRWKPDWDTAATKYERAAQIYRTLKKMDKAQKAFELTAEAHYNAGNIYLGGSNLESAAAIAKDQRYPAEAIKMYEKAAVMYQEDGKADRAAEVLTRAAKMCDNVEKATDLFNRAVDIYETDERYHMAGDTYRSFNAFLVKQNKLTECIGTLQRQVKAFEHLNQPHNKFKCFLSIMLLHIYLNDWVAADNAYNNYCQIDGGFFSSPEASLGQELLNAVDQCDEEALKTCISKQGWTFLENEIAKLVKKVKIFGGAPSSSGGSGMKSSSSNGNTRAKSSATSSSDTRAALFARSKPDSEDEEDDYNNNNNNEHDDEHPPSASASTSASKPAPVDEFDPNNLC